MTDPNPEPTTDPEPKQDPKPEPTTDPGKGFTPPATQEDLDRIIDQATAKVHKRYADYGDLQKKAQAHDKALEAAKSEQEKAVDAARKEGESAAAERANTRLINAEVRALAATAKFHDPTDAIAQLRGAGKLDGIKVDDEGSPDVDAIKGLLDDLAKAKPYLVVSEDPQAPSFNGGPRKTEPARAGSLGEAVRNRIAAGNH